MRRVTIFCLTVVVATITTGTVALAFADQRRAMTSLDLATLRDLRSLSVSPDGNWAAFQVVQADPHRNSYVVTWRVVATANRLDARRVADGGGVGPFAAGTTRLEFYSHEPPPRPVWSPDSAWITYLRWDGERAQIWRSNLRGEAEQLTLGEPHVRRFVYALDGARIYYETEPSLAQTRNALATEGRAGFHFDDRFFPAYDIRPLQPNSADFLLPVDLVKGPGKSQSASRAVWTYDLAGRRERPATAAELAEFKTLMTPSAPEQAQRMIGTPTMSRSGAVAWLDARDPERQGYEPPVTLVAQFRGGEPIVCNATACRDQVLKGLWWRNEGELIFLRAEEPQQMDAGLYAWRPSDGRLRMIVRTHAKLLRHYSSTGEAQSSCAIGSDRLICFYEDATSPRRLVAINLDSGMIETLFEPNPDFARFDLGPSPQHLEFRGRSGGIYHGVLALPPHRRSGQRLPLVIITYRCSGFLRGGMGDEYPVYPLAAEGFAILCLEEPDDSEIMATLNYSEYNRWNWQPNGEPRIFVESLQAAISYLDDKQIIDPDRVGITGLSHGAQHVGWALTNMPRLAAASTSGAPGTSGPFFYYLMTDQNRKLAPDAFGLSNPADTHEQWRVISFSPNVDRVRTPLLINAADHELMAALEPVIELRDAGRAVEMYVYPDEYHWKWQPAHRLAIYNRNIDWMNFWLRDVTDPDPAKAGQYTRWREMRVRLEAAQTLSDTVNATEVN